MKKATMLSGAFMQLIAATKAFCSKKNRRPQYDYIRLEFHSASDEVVAVAVDGFRMSVEHAVAHSNEDFTVYVRSNVNLPKNESIEIELTEDDEVIIRCNGYVFGYKQPKVSEYLDWEKLLSERGDATFKIAFNGDYLLSAVQAAKASVGGTYKTPIILEFRSNLEPVIIRTNKNDVKYVLPCRVK